MSRFLTISLAVALLSLPAHAQTGNKTGAKPGAKPSAKSGAKQVPQSRQQIRLSFAPVVKKAAPAVVNIRTVKGQGRSAYGNPFYGRRGRGALGSGVIVRPNGLIVTNFHVIRNASQIKVILADKREFEAKVLLKDQRTDLAILKVDPGRETLPVLELKDSDDVEVGDLVLAIGNPFGVGQTVTSGIVSALARTRLGITNYRFFIQTDAAINPGNSGGALITMDGRLLGINTAIFSRSGGSIGIGFAIPANMVRRVIGVAERGGKTVQRPWLGASVQPVNANLARTLGMRSPTGVIVVRVQPKSPAAEAGLKVQDVILKLNGRPVPDAQGLRFRLGTLPLSGTAKLSILRKGKGQELTFNLRSRPGTPLEGQLVRGRVAIAGAYVANITEDVIDRLNLQHRVGVVITRVAPGTNAARIGLKRGDLVLELNNVPVRNVADVMRVAGDRRFPRRWYQVRVRRGNLIFDKTYAVRGRSKNDDDTRRSQ